MTDPLPKYHRVYLVLREGLEQGRFRHGLPGELALTREFGVARVTVRKAMERLVAEGRIVRAPGRGTAPAPAAVGRPPLPGLLGNIVDIGRATAVRVLACETLPAPAEVAQALALADGAPVQRAVRVRSGASGPIAHVTTWVPAALAQRFGADELAREPLLVLLEAQGVRIGRAEQTVSAVLADAGVAPHLEVAVGSALLAVRRVVHDDDGRPVQRLHGLYRPDRYEYRMQLSRVGEIDAKVWVPAPAPGAAHPVH